MIATGDLSEDFFSALQQTATTLQCDPQDLLSVMQNESGVRATAHNPNGHASGLIQFMPKILRNLGWNFDPDNATNAENFRRLVRAEEQAAQWVLEYFRPYIGKLVSSATIYQATFLPATLSLGSDPSTVICDPSADPPLNPTAYEPNKGFDTDKKGYITVGDLQNAIDRATTGSRWNGIVDRLAGNSPYPSLDLNTIDGVQATLVAVGYDPGPIDGAMGGRTQTAITQFQQEKGEENAPLDGGNGVVAANSDTMTALASELDNRTPPLSHTP
jgi:hypothetical protein